jgi:hypothetical protein
MPGDGAIPSAVLVAGEAHRGAVIAHPVCQARSGRSDHRGSGSARSGEKSSRLLSP